VGTTYHLPPSLRGELKKPLGTLYPDDTMVDGIHTELQQPTEKIITVGDITTINLLEAGIIPNLAIIDQRTRRTHSITQIPPLIKHQRRVHNPPATITEELINAIRESLSQEKPCMIIVEGEEDLAVIPTVLLSPATSLVVYGQPDEGAVMIRVNEAAKQKIQKLLDKMKPEESSQSQYNNR
jgi:hypothetical protein